MENGEAVLCSCGNGQLPANFITGMPQWDSVSKYFVRAAVAPCFLSPFYEEPMDSDGMANVVDIMELVGFGGCRVCGRVKGQNGAALQKCGRCRALSYCSKQCQRADWKNHRRDCKRQFGIEVDLMQGMNGSFLGDSPVSVGLKNVMDMAD